MRSVWGEKRVPKSGLIGAASYQASKSPRYETKDDSEPHKGVEFTKQVVESRPEGVGLVRAKHVAAVEFERRRGFRGRQALLYVAHAKSLQEVFKLGGVVGWEIVLRVSRG